MKRLTTEEFILRAEHLYGDKYDYSKVNYINGSTKVPVKYASFAQNMESFGKRLITICLAQVVQPVRRATWRESFGSS